MPDQPLPYRACTIRTLPQDRWQHAAAHAIRINPANAPATEMLTSAGLALPSPAHLAIITAKYWGSGGVVLTVGFLEETPIDLQNKILSHMNAWSEYGNVSFALTDTDPQVRITRETADEGYWSYLGTDVGQIAADQPTMSLEGFTMGTRDSEFHRVVRHETGHTLGFPHEHLREEIVAGIDREKAIAYFMQTQGWTEQMVIDQVLTPIDNSELIKTDEPDEHSIMCYQLPAAVMMDGVAVPGGTDIDDNDARFIETVYPLPEQVVAAAQPAPAE
jgi:hypothetical protein